MTYFWERKKVHRIFNEFVIDQCFFVQKMPACAIDDANIPVWQACFALRFGFLEQFTQFDVALILNLFLWFLDWMGKRLDFVVDLVEEACRSGWFSFLWINSRTLVLCACFTTECGSPGTRKSMSASFTITFSWLKSSWPITDLHVLSRSVLSPTLNVSLSWTERV